MGKTFRPWDVDQGRLFPPAPKDLLPARRLAHFIREVVREELDLSAVYARYEEWRGYPPYHPGMMTALLLNGYGRGIHSSRRLEQACEEAVDFMVLTGREKPDHRTIGQFRTDPRTALSALFVPVLALCRDAGMVKLGPVALDGTKVKANASKHAATGCWRRTTPLSGCRGAFRPPAAIVSRRSPAPRPPGIGTPFVASGRLPRALRAAPGDLTQALTGGFPPWRKGSHLTRKPGTGCVAGS